ncbi:MAG: hypothetical protein QT00_C0002G0054 [archaeon GW2011_AR5]|nr:MAG: hypothetical protein QT00_C0002G0054 [archaeon GW2011_AR5]
MSSKKALGSEAIKIVDDVLSSPLAQKGMEEPLTREETAQVLAHMLFGVTDRAGTKLVEVRDFPKISEVGTFKYSGQADTMHVEGLMPDDVYEGLRDLKIDRHVGPCYLRVKGLLTHVPTRILFGRQMAFIVRDYLDDDPLSKEHGYVVSAPNMTGGAFIGDETGRQLRNILTSYPVWPATPYTRDIRKPIDAVKRDAAFVDGVEGLVPTPEETGAVLCFEELRTVAETTRNATLHYTQHGYNPENGVRIVEMCVFDYLHPAGVTRLERLGVDGLYAVNGKTFIQEARNLGYISDSQESTGLSWLAQPWDFTRQVLPDLRRLSGR